MHALTHAMRRICAKVADEMMYFWLCRCLFPVPACIRDLHDRIGVRKSNKKVRMCNLRRLRSNAYLNWFAYSKLVCVIFETNYRKGSRTLGSMNPKPNKNKRTFLFAILRNLTQHRFRALKLDAFCFIIP